MLPPFAEEMNRSRRLMAQTAMALAARGVASLVCDLYGTGDSSGDFADARWSIWHEDASRALAWMRAQGADAVSVLAIRLGALLALDIADACQRLYLLAPQLDGRQAMRQFLRVRVAADMERGMRGGAPGPSLADCQAMLAAGQVCEVAGYGLSGALHDAIAQRHAREHALGDHQAVHLLALAASGDPAVTRQAALLQASGAPVTVHHLTGPPVWQQIEPASAGDLAEAVAALIAARESGGDGH